MFKLQIKYLSFFFGIVSILSFFNILYSYYFNLYLNLDTYYYTLLASSILFITFFKFGKYDIASKKPIKIKILVLNFLNLIKSKKVAKVIFIKNKKNKIISKKDSYLEMYFKSKFGIIEGLKKYILELYSNDK